MQSSETGTTSAWMGVQIHDDGPLTSDAACDVCVVGAGIAGLSVAHELARRGRSVIVLDDGPVGGGETGRTTAHLATAPDDRFYQIENMHGPEAAAIAHRSHGAAVERIERVVREEGIDCDFQRLDGFLWIPSDLRGRADDLITKELAVIRRLGVPCERLDEIPGVIDSGPGLRFPDQGQFQPLRYLAGLAAAIRRTGGRVHTGTHATTIQGGTGAHVQTSDGKRVSAGHVVVATNSPVNDRVAIHTKQSAHRTYVVTLAVPSGSLPPALWWDGYWDDEDSYHYVRLLRGLPSRVSGSGTGGTYELIVGGEDHKTGQADDPAARWARLAGWARRHFLHAGEVTGRWSGQVIEPHDHFAFIGRNPLDADNVYIVTGDSGNGMTHGTIAAILIPELIDGRGHEWERVYSPSRVSIRSTVDYARENANVVAQYKDWVLPGHVDSVEQIPPGSGAVVRRGVHRVAVYRDHSGTLVERTARCPHMGCVVHWNPAERSWDCPCHGSRFDFRGNVLNGPANQDLGGPEHSRVDETPPASLDQILRRGTPGTA